MIEAEQRAAEAWEMMLRDESPMPPEVGLDYVQDVTDDRVTAATLLHDLGCVFLITALPPGPIDYRRRAIAVVELLGTDEGRRYRHRGPLTHLTVEAENRGGAEWVGWCHTAAQVFDALDAVWAKSEVTP